jgi:lycopene beta-cyclase
MPDCDYLITGAGCSGLSLVIHMLRSPVLSRKKIILIDRSLKAQNDRTWCFWEKEPGKFEQIVYRSWDSLRFLGSGKVLTKDIRPYRYKMIRGIDFYNFCFDQIRQYPNVEIINGEVESLHSSPAGTFARVGGRSVSASYLFNSILFEPPPSNRVYWQLLQHFKGWVIRAPAPVFDPQTATLMDFRTSQQQVTAFIYLMPFSPTEALLEYTQFSRQVLERSCYEKKLREYLRQHWDMDAFEILEEEFGVIPMTDRPFPGREFKMIHIGTAGGRTKPSSGYTFQFIQRQSRDIVASLERTGEPVVTQDPDRYRFYDRVLLNVLATGKLGGEQLFTALFDRNAISDIFPFLDNESNLRQDLKIITSLPVWPFLRAGSKEVFR